MRSFPSLLARATRPHRIVSPSCARHPVCIDAETWVATPKVNIMKGTFVLLSCMAFVAFEAAPAAAQTVIGETPVAQGPNDPETTAPGQDQAPPPPPPPAPQSPQALPPPPPQGPSGQWVNTEGSGWIWVPGGATTYGVEGVPYVYLYTPAYGWTWYASPWGPGPYVYGAWVSHPWPFGFRAWSYGPGGWGWRAGSFRGGAAHVAVTRGVGGRSVGGRTGRR